MASQGLAADDIAMIIPHQSNLRIIESATQKLGLPPEKVYINIDRYGNTSGASVPVAWTKSSRPVRSSGGSGCSSWCSARAHVGLGPDQSLMSKNAAIFPGQGSQSVGMGRLRPAPARAGDVRRGLDGAGRRLWALVSAARRRTGPDREHAAGDADGRRRGVARVARRGRRRDLTSSPATASASTRRSSPPARWRSAMRCRWSASARRPCKTPSRRASARWPRSWDSTRPALPRPAPKPRRGGRRSRQLQRPGPDRHRRARGGRRACDRGLQGAWREARRAAAGVGAVPQLADETGGRAARRAPRRGGDRAAGDPGVCTTSTSPCIAMPAAIRTALARQAASPVRWVETIQAMAARGVTRVVECGPGRVLTGMCKRIDPGLEGFALDDGDGIDTPRCGLTSAPRGRRQTRHPARQVALVTGATRGIGARDRARAGRGGRDRRRHGDDDDGAATIAVPRRGGERWHRPSPRRHRRAQRSMRRSPRSSRGRTGPDPRQQRRHHPRQPARCG